MDNLEQITLLNTNKKTAYQAAIIEDEPDMLLYIRNSLSEKFNMHNIPVTFDSFTSGIDFMTMINDYYHYDIIFMDIEMPTIDGIEICRRVRKKYQDSLIVFISGKDELVFKTFEVQPFRFIRKSQYKNQLDSLVLDCINQIKLYHRNILQFMETYSGDLYSISIDKIKYIEASIANCIIATDEEKIVVKCKFSTIEELLEDYHFIKPHRSYLVNCDYIFCIGKKELILSDHTDIPISRSRLPVIKQEFIKHTTR